MAKTEVILIHNLVGLGGESDQVKVAAGYARNYLLPQGLAIPVSAGNKRRLEALRRRRAEREAHEYNTRSELSKSITKFTCLVKVKTGEDGKMFGSVTSGTRGSVRRRRSAATVRRRRALLRLSHLRFTHHVSPPFSMAKTEVILIHNIVGLGGESDQVKVAAGYARNYRSEERRVGKECVP